MHSEPALSSTSLVPLFTEERIASLNSPRGRSTAIIRITDIVIASLALIFFAPLMLVLAIAVYIGDPGPVFFGHSRVGRNGRSFKCLKFRSMVVDADALLADILARDPVALLEWEASRKLTNDPRVNRLGRFLRVSSLDEIPQLWNVICGQMSLVGPRPVHHEELVRYGRYVADYSDIRPGITGLWQISGRSDTSYKRRVAMDVAYSRSLSFGLYIKILVLTVPAVVLARGSR